MRAYIIAGLMAALCQASLAGDLHFQFIGAGGESYNVETLGATLSEKLGYKAEPRVVLVYSPKLSSQLLKQQSEYIEAAPEIVESNEMLLVVASPEAGCADGYCVPPEKAKALVDDPKIFSVTLVGNGGEVLQRWSSPVSARVIQEAMRAAASNNSLQGRRP